MATYCTQADVEDILSIEGVTLATDDMREWADADADIVANAIERAGAKAEQYVLMAYESTALVGNVWMKWCVATLSAVELMRRRGNPVPASLEEAANEYIEQLKAVAEGDAIIPGATVRAEQGVAMSNMVHDMRFRQAKIRVLPWISTGRKASDRPRRVDINPFFYER